MEEKKRIKGERERERDNNNRIFVLTKQVVNNQGTLLLQRHVDKSVKLRMLKFSIPQTGSLMYIELAKYDFLFISYYVILLKVI